MTVVLSQGAPMEAEQAFEQLGFSVLRLPPHPVLPTPVASHPDMLIFPAPDAILCTASYMRVAHRELERLSLLCGRPVQAVTREYGRLYPQDILLNCATVGGLRFCLAPHVAEEIVSDFRFTVCSVKQGYAKCSTLPVGEHALITEDASICAAAQKAGADVLFVPSNQVRLEGYGTGFLGGSASFAPYGDHRAIYFCGSLDRHASGKEIRLFCASHGFEAISLFDGPLTDVGTMFLIEGEDDGKG